MKKVNIVGTVFGFISSFATTFLIITAISGDSLSGDSYQSIMILFGVLMGIGRIGSFVAGILQLVFQTKAKTTRGFMIAAGILNILGGMFVGPSFSLVCVLKESEEVKPKVKKEVK